MNREWTYKGHRCWIEQDVEDDNIKNWHYVLKPDGEKVCAPLSPYVGASAVNLWIDMGCPDNPQGTNYLMIDGKLV